MSAFDATVHERRALRDLALGVTIVMFGGALFLSIDATERVTSALVHWEAGEVDDLLLTLGLALVVAGWIAMRRWQDALTQLAEARRAATDRAWYLERLESLSSAMLLTEEHEQHRLAEVLHDEIGQTLYACQLKLDLAASSAPDTNVEALLREARELTSQALVRARDLSVQLSPPVLQDLGLEAALEELMPRLEQRYRIPLQLVSGEAWARVPSAFGTSVYRSIQELVVNAAKHAQASKVTISADVREVGGVAVSVMDDGLGFCRAGKESHGFGLFSIERRMACMNGSLEVVPARGRGTVATLHFPSSRLTPSAASPLAVT